MLRGRLLGGDTRNTTLKLGEFRWLNEKQIVNLSGGGGEAANLGRIIKCIYIKYLAITKTQRVFCRC